jgi:phage-related minor tail protein
MARASVATALAQALVGVVALFIGSVEGFLLSGFFVGVWLLSAWLFHRAQGKKPTQGAAPQWASPGLRR